jgi:hypothetical protein
MRKMINCIFANYAIRIALKFVIFYQREPKAPSKIDRFERYRKELAIKMTIQLDAQAIKLEFCQLGHPNISHFDGLLPDGFRPNHSNFQLNYNE